MIDLFKVHMPASVDGPLLETLHSGKITQGEKVEAYESELELRLGFSNALSLNSCTSAITLALRLANVGPGDEVITTPMTCAATNLPILAAGATPVWADIDPISGLIDPISVIRMMTAKTKAVIAVDWGGRPAPVREIRNGVFAGVKIIEDAAHALGARRRGSLVGADGYADFYCFSTQAIKHITTGDGGILVCYDDDDYERGKRLRWFGIDRDKMADQRIEDDIPEWGYKFHMNDLNATIGLEQLRYLESIVARQRMNAVFYDNNLPYCFTSTGESSWVSKDDDSASWLYTTLVPDGAERDGFIRDLAEDGIQASRVHARVDRHSCFAGSPSDLLPGVDHFDSRQVNIPVHWALSADDLSQVATACTDIARKNRWE